VTILDVLRYSVTDIYNAEELDALPVDLFIIWLADCSSRTPEIIGRAVINQGISRRSLVKATVEVKVLYETSTRNSHRNSGWGELYKAKFMKRLKEMIAEYEPI
jgi:hypothetical protein